MQLSSGSSSSRINAGIDKNNTTSEMESRTTAAPGAVVMIGNNGAALAPAGILPADKQQLQSTSAGASAAIVDGISPNTAGSGLPRSISDTKLRQARPNLTLPLPPVTSLMHFKVYTCTWLVVFIIHPQRVEG